MNVNEILAQANRELTRVLDELVAQRAAYADLIRVAEDKVRLLGQAQHDRDQYLTALRKIEKLCEEDGRHGCMTVLIDEIRSCYADVPGVVA